MLTHKDFDLFIETDELKSYIDQQFINYENASHNANEWQQMVAHSRLDGILWALISICAESTEEVRRFMVECTEAQYLPFGYSRYRP